MRIAIIGGGGWGIALAKLLAENQHHILMWEFNPRNLELLQQHHGNPLLLKDIVLPPAVTFTGDPLEVAAYSPEMIILATPTQFLRNTIKHFPPELWQGESLQAVVNVAKGIEEHSLKRIDEILLEELPPLCHPKVCALSGPSHAEEVARGIPTTVVIAGSDEQLLQNMQKVFSNSYFRVYRSSDLIGVEIGGAVKNVIAIAAGILRGLGYGDNTMGALLTRGIVEIIRFGKALNAKPETFLGLSGIGDLITTSISLHSRNFHVGFELGQGKSLQDILNGMNMVAEGVSSTRSVYQLASKLHVEMPITTQVYQVLYVRKAPQAAITELMTRELKPE